VFEESLEREAVSAFVILQSGETGFFRTHPKPRWPLPLVAVKRTLSVG
jgi:hypothetical protein